MKVEKMRKVAEREKGLERMKVERMRKVVEWREKEPERREIRNLLEKNLEEALESRELKIEVVGLKHREEDLGIAELLGNKVVGKGLVVLDRRFEGRERLRGRKRLLEGWLRGRKGRRVEVDGGLV